MKYNENIKNEDKKQMTHIRTLLKLLYQARFVEKDKENIPSA